MTQAVNIQYASTVDSSPAGERHSLSARVQLKRSLASLSYEEQVAAVQPGGQSSSPMSHAADAGSTVQLAADPVQMETPSVAASASSPATGAAEATSAGGPAASTAPTPATMAVRRSDLAAITTPAITAGTGDPPVTLGPGGTSIAGSLSDSPDPVKLKDQIITQTKAFLDLPETTPEPTRQAELAKIKETFELLRAAMKHARGENDELVALRVQFEKFLGTKAEGEWPQGVTCVENMVTSAKQMIVAHETGVTVVAAEIDTQLGGLSDATKAAIGKKLGTPTNMGFAGVVGQSFNAIMLALNNGSLVQKAQGLINFSTGYLVERLMEGGAQVIAAVRANLASCGSRLDLDALIAEAAGVPPKEQKKILLSSPEFRAKLDAIKLANGHIDSERGVVNKGAKLGGEMDTKMPETPVDLLDTQQLLFLAQQANPAIDLSDCPTDAAKIKKLKDAGIKTSKAPGGAVDATSIHEVEDGQDVTEAYGGITIENKAYIEGKMENIVDPKNQWIIDANAAQAPLKAGISGTTARFVGAAQMMGGDINGAVVAMLGHLQAIEAHSFWEIVEGAGLGMAAGKYTPFPPNDAGMIAAATQFINQPEHGYADLGAADKEKNKKTLLGEP